MHVSIFPTPKKLNVKEGAFALYNASIYVDKTFDYRVKKAAIKLRSIISESTGNFHKFAVLTDKATKGIIIKFNENIDEQAYVINANDTVLTVEAGDDAGAFYGIQTLIQLVNANGMALPIVEIEDCPDLKHRGFYHDATRGRVPSVDGVKEIIDQIALTKMNSLQLYVEHPFEFLEFSNVGNTYDDILTADSDCFGPAGDSHVVYPAQNGEAYESLRLDVFHDALQDVRAFKLCEQLYSKEFVMNIIEDGIGELTFKEYPWDAEYILNLRERINQAIKEKI